QADFLLDLALANHRLLNAADVLVRIDSRNIHRDLKCDLVQTVNARCYVDVHADVDVVELRVHQWVDTYAANAGLERSRRDRHTLAELERRLLSIERAYLRLLQNLRCAVGVEEECRGSADGHLEISGIQVGEAVQVNLTGSTAGR